MLPKQVIHRSLQLIGLDVLRHRPGGWRLDPLPEDPRDPDIVRAKALARRTRPSSSAPVTGRYKDR